jgi:hypothetical protein
MILSTNWKIHLTVDDILRGQGADPQIVHTRKPSLLKAAERALSHGLGLLHPKVLSSKVAVKEHRHERITLLDGATLTGPAVTRQLSGAQHVVASVCTIGSKLEEVTAQLLREDPLYALALDGLGNAAVESLAQLVCGGIAEQIEQEGLQASAPLSPGSPEWPVEIGQPQIFSLLDSSKAGITLTTGGMMVPRKSVSFVVGLGPEMSQISMCSVCSLKETCRYQHA